MAKLTTEKRKQMKDEDFGIPSKRMYPLWNTGSEESDRKHVMSAVRLFGHAADEDKPELARNILKRAKELNIDSSGWDQINAWAKKKTNKTESDKSSSDVKKECYIPLSEFSHYFREYYDSEIEALFEECDELIEESELLMYEDELYNEYAEYDDDNECFTETYQPYDEWLRLHKYDPATNTIIIRGHRVPAGNRGSKKERNRINKFLRENDFDPKTETIASTDIDGNPTRTKIGLGFAHPDADAETVKAFLGSKNDSIRIGGGRDHTIHNPTDELIDSIDSIRDEMWGKYGEKYMTLLKKKRKIEEQIDEERDKDEPDQTKISKLEKQLEKINTEVNEVNVNSAQYEMLRRGDLASPEATVNLSLSTLKRKPSSSNFDVKHEIGHEQGNHLRYEKSEKQKSVNKQGDDFADFTRARMLASGRQDEYNDLLASGHFGGREFTADELSIKSNPHSKQGREVGYTTDALKRDMINDGKRAIREKFRREKNEEIEELQEQLRNPKITKKERKRIENEIRDLRDFVKPSDQYSGTWGNDNSDERKDLVIKLRRARSPKRRKELEREIERLNMNNEYDGFDVTGMNTDVMDTETEYRKQYASIVNAQEHERHMAEQRRRNERMIERLQTQIDSGKLDPKQLEKAKKKLARIQKFMDMGTASARSRSTRTGGVRQNPSKSSVKREKRERRDAEWLRQGQELKKQFDEFRANGNQLTAKQERELSKRT